MSVGERQGGHAGLREPLGALTDSTNSVAMGAARIETALNDVPDKVQEGVSRALKTTQLTVQVQAVPGELEVAIAQLAGSVQRLEARLSRPSIWRRILRRKAK